MTEKICKKCMTYNQHGKYCCECGQQLFPDVGFTEWKIPEPKFDVWTGEKIKYVMQNP